jgi:hypothetical protein
MKLLSGIFPATPGMKPVPPELNWMVKPEVFFHVPKISSSRVFFDSVQEVNKNKAIAKAKIMRFILPHHKFGTRVIDKC